MQELIPFAAGALIGLLVTRIRSTTARIAVFGGLCLAVGTLVSYATGELAESWAFVSVDAALVWLGAFAAVGVYAAQRRLAWR